MSNARGRVGAGYPASTADRRIGQTWRLWLTSSDVSCSSFILVANTAPRGRAASGGIGDFTSGSSCEFLVSISLLATVGRKRMISSFGVSGSPNRMYRRSLHR